MNSFENDMAIFNGNDGNDDEIKQFLNMKFAQYDNYTNETFYNSFTKFRNIFSYICNYRCHKNFKFAKYFYELICEKYKIITVSSNDECVLSNGYDISDYYNYELFEIACYCGQLKIAKWLLKKSPNIFKINIENKSIIYNKNVIAIISCISFNNCFHILSVIKWLIQQHLNINYYIKEKYIWKQDEFDLVIRHALLGNNTKVVKLLLKYDYFTIMEKINELEDIDAEEIMNGLPDYSMVKWIIKLYPKIKLTEIIQDKLDVYELSWRKKNNYSKNISKYFNQISYNKYFAKNFNHLQDTKNQILYNKKQKITKFVC